MVPLIRKILITVLAFQRRRAELEEQFDREEIKELGQRLEEDIKELWRQMAGLQALGKPNAKADPDYPGYVEMKIPDFVGESLYVPFHLVPATPDLPVLNEVMSLAARVRVGEVDGRRAAICLSGSTVILKDVLRVGDVDFCEYIPAEVPADSLANAFREQVMSRDTRYCTVSIRMTVKGQADELKFVEASSSSGFTNKQIEPLCRLISMAQNGKTSHVIGTGFAGVTEVTNWLVMFTAPLENDPASRLSFAHQEAAMNSFGRRSLHILETLSAYLNFLGSEIKKYARNQPVKALKRAIPWLRLFCNDDLRSELLQRALDAGVLARAAVLAKMELVEKYDGKTGLRTDLTELLDALQEEVNDEVQLLTGDAVDPKGTLRKVLQTFGQDFAAEDGRPSLLKRILSLAETEEDP